MWRQDALTTYSACPPNPIRKVKSVDAFREKQGSSPLAKPPFISGKYTTANSVGAKQLPEIKDFAPLRPFVIIVSGASNVGKSALIKLAQNKLRLAETTANNERRHVHTLSIEDMTYPVEMIELNIDMFDTSQEPLQMPKDLPKVDGGLICFDLTNKDSMDCLPDLLSKEIFPLCGSFHTRFVHARFCQTIQSQLPHYPYVPIVRTEKIDLFHSLHIPLFLLGLKSDLSHLRQVDAHLASNLGKLFNAPFSEINSFSQQCSRRLVEICANVVLSCAGKRQDIDFEPLRTFDFTINKQPSKPTLRERRLIGEPTMKIGTNTNYSNKQIGYGKHSPKNLEGLWTASSPPDHGQHVFDSIKSPQPQASKSMPAARNRIEQHANGGDRTPNTSLSSSHISPTFPQQTTTGFVYAPTKSVHDTSSQHLPSPSFKPLPSLPRHHAKSSFSDQTSILDSISNMTSVTSDSKMNKRNSKDSGESFSPGMTIEDIIDRLTQSTGPATDDKFSLIFMTFFRRFMRPRELVELLTERFGNDVNAKKLPTPQQNKIHEFFCQWLSTYWGDFCSVQTRKLLMLHLEVLSQHTDLRPMCDDLAPLIIREPPSDDPDTRWGLIDIEDSTQDPSTPATSYSTEGMEFGKKDSGYVGSFDSAQFLDLHSPVLQSMSIDSDQSHNVDNGIRKQLPEIPSKTTSNAINSHRGRNVAHMHSTSHSRYHDPMKPKAEGIYHERNKWQQEFAGGLVNIDTHARHGPNSSAASIMSQLAGGARPEKDLAQSCFKTFTGFSEEALADQLTWIESELFYRIKPRQLIRNVWSTKARRHFTPSISSMDQIKSPVAKEPYTPPVNNHHTTCPVLASIAHFNFISAWVSTMIVMQSKLSRRGKVLEKFMHMAVALRNRNNYNTLMAVLAGINSASVLRLRHTRDWVSVKKIYKQFQSLERLMSTDRSFGSYRLALKASEAPGIPYLGIHNQDLLSLAEANKDFKVDGTIHWEKFRLMGDTILAMIRFQEPKFSIQPDAKILGFIAETDLMNEDEQFRQSTAIEPRLKATSTNRLRDLWFRV